MDGYQLTQRGTVIRLRDGAHIPKDEGNADYLIYLKWIEDGNTPLAASDDEPVFAGDETTIAR
jgi:hypothetical protein